MKLPPDSPDWLEAAVNELKDRASEMVRKGEDPSRAAGYFSAVADLEDEILTQSELIEAKRQKLVREMRLGASGG